VNVDTLAVDLDGNGAWDPENESVRLLGIRGPSYDEAAGIYEYPSAEAVAWLQQLVGDWVQLDDDRREEGIYRQDPPPEVAVTEDYRILAPGGPWLAYCHVGDVWVNRELLDLGYAWIRDEVPCNRLSELREAQARAQRKGIGVWEFRKKS
jgi:endonuclease YncB( thermonuclease family)